MYEKIVYTVIARFADRQDTAFPGYNTIAKKAGISRRTAINTVKKLHLKGLLVKHERKTGNNGNQSNLYLLLSAGANNPYECTNIKQSKNEADQQKPNICDIHPSAQDAPPSACDAPPSAQGAPPLVHEVHPPSAHGAPEQYLYNNTYFNNNNIKREPVVVGKSNKGLGDNITAIEQEPDETNNKVRDLLKDIDCINHKYSITDSSTIKTIIKAYTSDAGDFLEDKFVEILEHIKNSEPEEGYRNIAGVIIKAKDYDIPYKALGKSKNLKLNAPKKFKTRFHLSESRFEKYSAEELEKAVLNKNPAEKINEEKEREILNKLKYL